MDYFAYNTAFLSADPYQGYKAQHGYRLDTGTGLYLCTFRYYDPQTGRFLTRDPIGYAGGINLYAYADNNPVMRADPSGLESLEQRIGAFFMRLFGLRSTKGATTLGNAMDGNRETLRKLTSGSPDDADAFVRGTLREAAGRTAKVGPPVRKFLTYTVGTAVIAAITVRGPHLPGAGDDYANSVAGWLGNKGAVVEREVDVGIAGLKTAHFDGKVGRLLFEVKSGFNPGSTAKDIEQIVNQSKVAKSLGMNYRVFAKGSIPESILKVLNRRGIRYTILP